MKEVLKLVPLEPTNNMKSAASQLFAKNPKATPSDYYRVMVDCAKEALAQPEQEYDWKDLYEKEKRRSAMWLAKYEEVAGPAPKAYPLAQPEQVCRGDGRCQYAIDSGAEGMGHCPKGKCVMPAQPEQEPVAILQCHPKQGPYLWHDVNEEEVNTNRFHADFFKFRIVYTTPPQRKPLTEAQAAEAWPFVWRDHEATRNMSIVRAIEAKSKEKNT